MTTIDQALETALASLSVPAPRGLRSEVLVQAGLADHYARIDSPIGGLIVAWNGLGVSSVSADVGDIAFEARHLADTGRLSSPAPGGIPDRLAALIGRRLDGDRRARVRLDLRGHTTFEQDVWLKALEIPRGEVRPYGWIAAEIGRPKAVRAVGTALGHNPVPLIVPCHRVVRTDGSIGQYSLGGPDNKRTILSAEGLDPDGMEDAARRGERLIGCASTHIVCWPSCRTGRHMLARNRRPFRNLADAADAGYRPCKVCRPVDGSIGIAA
jgi:O-6-methylguanine DNA methyltransferase